ncbi:MAG: aminotransferase class I/II-fold pyridoxal phosphate-dependent enzyme [Pseudomonadales bacterium]|nr:aminotransferase class I/II-fold pyridoxal phosphate-dependent enzyme [Pseudomonadales bacterium]
MTVQTSSNEPDPGSPAPNRELLSLAPFRQGKAAVAGFDKPIKLSANESHLGPSPAAIAAFRESAQSLANYPDGAQTQLRSAIAATFALPAENIVCGNGSDELLQLLIRGYLRPGDQIVFSRYSFAMAMVHATAQGATLVIADEPQLRPDANEILAAVNKKTRMVLLASPNNPVGQYIAADELWRLHRELPPDVLLVVDSAYADYVVAPDYECGAALVAASSNTVMTRTFSKLYGLAGARIGWCYAPSNVVDMLQRIRTPFNASTEAMAAAAAAVLDVQYSAHVRDYNARELQRIAAAVRANFAGVEFIPSFANFYLLRFDNDRHTAAGAAAALEQRGIIPRPVGAGGPDRCLRITVGLTAENDAVLAVLSDYLRSG